jgi:hypothetical protein
MKKITLLLGTLLTFACAVAFAEEMPMSADGPQHKNITRAEFSKHAEEHFTKMDTNSDGLLSPEERKAGREKMREHRRERKEQRSEKMSPAAQ